MDWKAAIREEREALMRTVTLLRALACLAELAASRSAAVRCFVLWVLRHAEAVARDFVAGPDTRLALMPPAGCRPADAMRLAASLRALARQLYRQLEHQARLMLGMCGGRSAPTKRPLGVMPAMREIAKALSLCAAFAWPIPHPAPDTS